MSDEFETIAKFFKPLEKFGNQQQFSIGQGDDCAVIHPSKFPMAISIDTQVESVHFYADMEPGFIAQRGLCSALSDLAAMGAEPAFFTLALSIPDSINDSWLASYSAQLARLSDLYGVTLVGGDTTSSTIIVQTFQVHGFLHQEPLTRAGAAPGDIIVVSGTLGNAALAVKTINAQLDVHPDIIKDYNQPTPKFEISRAISHIASACIDISDGLVADLGHICKQSQCGADINLDALPLSPAFKNERMEPNMRYQLSATGGDDYQLCFTLPESAWKLLSMQKLPLTAIGKITTGKQVCCYNKHGESIQIKQSGFQHR